MDNGEKILLQNMGKSIENGFASVDRNVEKVHKRINNVEQKQTAANVMLGIIKDVVTKHVDNEDIHFKKELISDHIASKDVHFTKVDLRDEQRKRRRETIIFFATLFIAYGGIAFWIINIAKKAFLK